MNYATSASCPVCRCEPPQFAHDSVAAERAATHKFDCECGESVPYAQREEHTATTCPETVVACPFTGCVFTTRRRDIDQHTCACLYAAQYASTEVLRRLDEDDGSLADPPLGAGEMVLTTTESSGGSGDGKVSQATFVQPSRANEDPDDPMVCSKHRYDGVRSAPLIAVL